MAMLFARYGKAKLERQMKRTFDSFSVTLRVLYRYHKLLGVFMRTILYNFMALIKVLFGNGKEELSFMDYLAAVSKKPPSSTSGKAK